MNTRRTLIIESALTEQELQALRQQVARLVAKVDPESLVILVDAPRMASAQKFIDWKRRY